MIMNTRNEKVVPNPDLRKEVDLPKENTGLTSGTGWFEDWIKLLKDVVKILAESSADRS
jgi:hypothetical protein